MSTRARTPRSPCSGAYSEDERTFESELLGVDVKVVGVDVTDASELVAVCRRGKNRLKIPLVDLPMPSPPPEGAEWIEAFRRWRKGR